MQHPLEVDQLLTPGDALARGYTLVRFRHGRQQRALYILEAAQPPTFILTYDSVVVALTSQKHIAWYGLRTGGRADE